jgi:hypothetical protein
LTLPQSILIEEKNPTRNIKKGKEQEENQVKKPKAPATSWTPGSGREIWFRAKASPPVPMVIVNQFGVKLRTT